jgi:hypothetical protein
MLSRPVLCALLVYAGLSASVRQWVDSASTAPAGSTADYALYGAVAAVSVIVGQVVELITRSKRQAPAIETLADRAPRLITSVLAVAALVSYFVINDMAWGGQSLFGAIILAGTITGELLYQFVGKKRPLVRPAPENTTPPSDTGAPAPEQPEAKVIDLTEARKASATRSQRRTAA